VAYYPFNGNANDESGNENHGIVYGATLTTDRFNKPNRAFSFDGIDDYIEYGSDLGFEINNEITISTWVKWTSLGGPIVTKWKTESGWRGSWSLTGTQFAITNNGWDGFSANINNSLTTDTYYHIAGTYLKGQIKIFINGIESGTGSGQGSIFTSDAKIRIGGNHWYVNGWRESYLNGIIDDVRIYSRALSIEEIQTLYYEGGWGK
jgi:hypothetical protein